MIGLGIGFECSGRAFGKWIQFENLRALRIDVIEAVAEKGFGISLLIGNGDNEEALIDRKDVFAPDFTETYPPLKV